MKGFTKCDNNILFSNELDAISKLVYTSINFYTRNGVGECFAKKTTLARMLNISTYQLRKSLNQLEHLQLIHIERPGQGHPDTITLMDGKPRSKDISHHTPSLLYKEEKLEVEDTSTSEDDTEKATEVSSDDTLPDTLNPPDDTQSHPDLSQHLSDTELLLRGITEKIRDKKRMDLYFSGIRVVGKDDCKLVISHKNEVVRDLLRSNHYHQLLCDVSGKNIEIVR